MTDIIQSDRAFADAMLSDLCAPMTDFVGEAAAAHFAAYRRALYEPTPERVERVARVLAPFMEGGREFDQCPPDRIALRKWRRMCRFNDATQSDAIEAARAAIAAMGE